MRGRRARRCWSWTGSQAGSRAVARQNRGKRRGIVAAAPVAAAPAPPTRSIRGRTQDACTFRGIVPMSLAALRVMVVEDHGFQRRMALRLLAELGIEPACRKPPTAPHALLDPATQQAHPPDVVLVDLDMPGMDGIEFIGHVAQRRLARARRGGQRAGPGPAQHRADDGARLRPARAGQHREAADARQAGSGADAATKSACDATRRRRVDLHRPGRPAPTAWSSGEIVPWFQPQVEFAQRQGRSASRRWRAGSARDGSVVRPHHFVAAARSAKAWSTRSPTACSSRPAAGSAAGTTTGMRLKLSVNVSAGDAGRSRRPPTATSRSSKTTAWSRAK